MIAAMGLSCVPLLSASELWVDQSSTNLNAKGNATAPFTTIHAAIDAASAGDTVTVKAGTYHESITLPSGTEKAPFTLRSAPGERVVVSTLRAIGGWKPVGDGIYSTTVDWNVRDLHVGYAPQPLAIWPNKDRSWRPIAAVDRDTGKITDGDGALGKPGETLAKAPADTYVYAYVKRGNAHQKFPLENLDASDGVLGLGNKKRWGSLNPGDSYRLCNHGTLIDRPGEWAYQSLENHATRLFFKPASPADLERTQARGRDSSAIFAKPGTRHARVTGIETAGGMVAGIHLRDTSNIDIESCVAYASKGNGILLRNVAESHIKHCIVFGNHTGISVSAGQNILIEENEVAANRMDGIIVSGNTSGPWKKGDYASENVMVRRNYAHHHLDLGHPDNFQMYRGTKNVHFVDNVGLWAGQTLMMQEAIEGSLEGNTFLGSGAVIAVFGHGNSDGWNIRGNTLGLGGWGPFSFTGKDYTVHENILYGGNSPGTDSYQGDRNLLLGDALGKGYFFTAKPRWTTYKDVAAFFAVTGQDKHSAYGDPQFENIPARQAVVKEKHPKGTAARLFLQQGNETTTGFAVGDHVEINGDGILRTVKTVDDESIGIKPALPCPPFRVALVWNWKNQTNFQLDLTPAPGSPALTMGEDGGRIGSKIDIRAFQRGDFDGDGTRDLPELDHELIQEAWPTINDPVIPSVGI